MIFTDSPALLICESCSDCCVACLCADDVCRIGKRVFCVACAECRRSGSQLVYVNNLHWLVHDLPKFHPRYRRMHGKMNTLNDGCRRTPAQGTKSNKKPSLVLVLHPR